MKNRNVLAVAAVCFAAAVCVSAGEMEVMRAESGVKFNEALLNQSAAGLKIGGALEFSPPAPVAEAGAGGLSGAVSGQAPLAVAQGQSAAPTAPAAAPAGTAAGGKLKHNDPCYDYANGYYYDCHDHHHNDHDQDNTVWAPTVATSISSALVMGALAAWIFTTPIGLLVGLVVLVVSLSVALGKKK